MARYIKYEMETQYDKKQESLNFDLLDNEGFFLFVKGSLPSLFEILSCLLKVVLALSKV